MKTILRYELPKEVNDIKLPVDYQLLKAGVAVNQNGKEVISIWVLAETDENYVPDAVVTERFCVFGTGADLDSIIYYNPEYIDTVKFNTYYAFHIFKVKLQNMM